MKISNKKKYIDEEDDEEINMFGFNNNKFHY